jgi:hypothetical protein
MGVSFSKMPCEFFHFASIHPNTLEIFFAEVFMKKEKEKKKKIHQIFPPLRV